MAKYDYGAYFGPIEPLADATRNTDTRVWGNGTEKDKAAHDYVLYLGCNVLCFLSSFAFDFLPGFST